MGWNGSPRERTQGKEIFCLPDDRKSWEKVMEYYPEGFLFTQEENRRKCKSLSRLREAAVTGEILEAKALLCDSSHNLIVDLGGGLKGVIPRTESALGIAEVTVRDIAILSRVNKPVCFKVTGFAEDPWGQLRPRLSRRAAQEECVSRFLDQLRPGDVIPGRVTHLEQFGAFVDIGCGVVSLIPIDAISVSRISHPRDRFFVGEEIFAVVRSLESGRITLSHRELLGSWEENAACFSPGETVSGVIRSVEDYGIFVELTPNLAGLAEKREGVFPGQQASVFIKNLLPEKMKVKLILIDSFGRETAPQPLRYFITKGPISHWVYSTPQCEKRIETVF